MDWVTKCWVKNYLQTDFILTSFNNCFNTINNSNNKLGMKLNFYLTILRELKC